MGRHGAGRRRRSTTDSTIALGARSRSLEVAVRARSSPSDSGAPVPSEGSAGGRYGGPSNATHIQAQRPIESAAERKGASVGPEGRTERSNWQPKPLDVAIGGLRQRRIAPPRMVEVEEAPDHRRLGEMVVAPEMALQKVHGAFVDEENEAHPVLEAFQLGADIPDLERGCPGQWRWIARKTEPRKEARPGELACVDGHALGLAAEGVEARVFAAEQVGQGAGFKRVEGLGHSMGFTEDR